MVLAPMAGITNRAFRRLARESARAVRDGATGGIYVTEMVTSRALLERDDETMRMIAMDPDESPRSVQLYGVDPDIVEAAVRLLVSEDRADHVDLNMGCPVPKVTRKGGGAALPWKRQLFKAVVSQAVRAAEEESARRNIDPVPVTVKMRMGIDADHLTYLEAGKTAAQQGISWVALHGRTASQMYGGNADWSAIGRLVEELQPLGVPVLGNGDIWGAPDALAMVAQSGCAGVVVGRGCLGRPWLFGQLVAAFGGVECPPEPTLGEVISAMRRHLQLLIEIFGEYTGVREMRKHMAWYTKGFPIGSEIRRDLGLIESIDDFDRLTAMLNVDAPYPIETAKGPRGRTTSDRRPSLPEGWLDDRDSLPESQRLSLHEAELSVSGG